MKRRNKKCAVFFASFASLSAWAVAAMGQWTSPPVADDTVPGPATSWRAHIARTNNPHRVTAAQLGALTNVLNGGTTGTTGSVSGVVSGQVTVTVGLYAQGSSERLPLSGDLLGQREYRVATLQMQPMFDGVLVVFKDGWHPAEAAPDNPALEWQWTRKESTLSFRNPRQNAMLYLHYDGQPAMAGSPQTVSVQLHGEVVDTFQVTGALEDIRRIPLKAAQFGNDDLVEVRLVVDKTFVPAAAVAGNRDTRELGIRVYHAYVEPQ